RLEKFAWWAPDGSSEALPGHRPFGAHMDWDAWQSLSWQAAQWQREVSWPGAWRPRGVRGPRPQRPLPGVQGPQGRPPVPAIQWAQASPSPPGLRPFAEDNHSALAVPQAVELPREDLFPSFAGPEGEAQHPGLLIAKAKEKALKASAIEDQDQAKPAIEDGQAWDEPAAVRFDACLRGEALFVASDLEHFISREEALARRAEPAMLVSVSLGPELDTPPDLSLDSLTHHYFFCLGGIPGSETGLKPLKPLAIEGPKPPLALPPPPLGFSRRPASPGPERRGRRSSSSRSRSRRRRRRSSPSREWEGMPVRQMLLQRLAGSSEELKRFARAPAPGFVKQIEVRKIIAPRERAIRKSRRPVVIDFGSGPYHLVLGSLKDAGSHAECAVFEAQDAPAALACQMGLDAGEEALDKLRAFLEGKRHAIYDPAEGQAWEDFPRNRQYVDVTLIRHSHDFVQATFAHGEHRGESVQDLIDDLLDGRAEPEDLTPLVLIKFSAEEFWAVFGNRRLKALKELEQRTQRPVTMRCLVWDKERAPAALAAKLVMSATTRNQGRFAGFKGKGKGR
ncbi:unnamed protein product, partial [Effrenium voratum]